MSGDTLLLFGFPTFGGKRAAAAFDGGRLPDSGTELRLQPAMSRRETAACP